MPPHRIIIVRHSEREDQVHPEFAKTYPRPHDSPLTEKGLEMATRLGKYLADEYGVHSMKKHRVMVLTSPLVRCVQTSDRIVDAIVESHGDEESQQSKKCFIPIYLEPSIMEGDFYLMNDMKKNPSVVTPTELHVPDPLSYDAAYFHRNYSKYVRVEKPFFLGGDPNYVITSNSLTEKDFQERNLRGVKGLLENLEFDGKTVILVGHGETVLIWYCALTGMKSNSNLPCPPYTGFVVLNPADPTSRAVENKWVPDGPVFSVPHLNRPKIPGASW